MTVSSTSAKAGPTTGNGVATSFPFDFKVFADADLQVVLADVSSGAETILTLDSDYSVTLNPDQDNDPGGSVTYPLAGSPMTNASTLTIVADLEITQPTDITNGGGFYADVVEKMVDRNVMLIRQLGETVSRALKLAVSTPDGVSADLPAPVANNILGWNADGTGFKNFAPVDNTLLSAALAAPPGSSLVCYSNSGTAITTEEALDILYVGSQSLANPRFAGGLQTTNTGAQNRAVFAAAAAYTGPLHIPPGSYDVAPTATLTMACSRFVGDGVTISLTASLTASAFKFTALSKLEGITFDGNGNSFCLDNDHYLVKCFGTKLDVQRCAFQNATGLQDQFQYGLGIDWNCSSTVKLCHFEEIHTHTNTAGNGGFCGGVFIATDPDNIHNIGLATHSIEGCTFKEVYTLANSSGVVYPDSDGIRNFVYDSSSLTADEAAMALNSTIKVSSCTFLNVLKSGVKLNTCIVEVDTIRFRVTDAHAQTQVYAAVRYQTGSFVSVRDVSVSGLLIANGVLVSGAKSFVDGLYFTSTYTDASAVFVGNSADDQVVKADIGRVMVDCAAKLATIQYADAVVFTGCDQLTDHDRSIEFVSDVGSVAFDGCMLKGKLSDYPGSANTISSITLLNKSQLSNTSSSTCFGSSSITELTIDDSSVTESNAGLLYQNVGTLNVVNGSKLSFAGTLSNRPIDMGANGAKFNWQNSELVDTSASDISIYTACSENRIDGMVSNSNATSYQVNYASPNTTTNSVNNVRFKGTAKFAEFDACDSMTVSNIRSEVAGGYIEFFDNNTGNVGAVVNFTGLLAETPVVANANCTITQANVIAL